VEVLVAIYVLPINEFPQKWMWLFCHKLQL